MLRLTLGMLGDRVLTAGDGVDALQVLSTNKAPMKKLKDTALCFDSRMRRLIQKPLHLPVASIIEQRVDQISQK